MKGKKTVWGSVSVLIGVVIAIIALAPRSWGLPMLAVAFAGWGMWLVWTQAIPLRRIWQTYRQKGQTVSLNQTLAQTLLRHVNYRVSDCLKAAYPDARWEWTMRDPAQFVAQGGIGRIRVYGIPDYNFADVAVDQNGKLSCSLVQLAPVERTVDLPLPPNQQKQDPQAWYNAEARHTLGFLIADLESRGHSELLLKEDGSICVRTNRRGTEDKQGSLENFPAKGCWNRLAEVLAQDGLAATVLDAGIVVTW